MSYTIIYDRQFIKVSDTEFLPVVLGGSSNVFESTHRGEKRMREWTMLTIGEGVLVSGESIKEYLEKQLVDTVQYHLKDENTLTREQAEAEVKAKWGYFRGIKLSGRKRLTFQGYKSFLLNACKEAVSIEDLVAQGGGLHFQVIDSERSKLSNNPDRLDNYSVWTTEEFWNALGAFKLCYGNTGWRINVGNYSLERVRQNIIRDKRYKKNTTTIIAFKRVEHFFVCQRVDDPMKFLSKFMRFGYKYWCSATSRLVKKFATENQAMSFLKRSERSGWVVKKINEPIDLRVLKKIKPKEQVCL
jgi:hypothetical protein